jgi:homoserine kinase type II
LRLEGRIEKMRTKVNVKQITKLLKEYNLGKLYSLRKILFGVENTNIKLNSSKGKFVFKLYEVHSRPEIEFEISIIRKLYGIHYPVPKVVLTVDKEYLLPFRGKFAVVFEFIEGKKLKKILNPQLAKEIASLLALFDKSLVHFNPEGKKDSHIHDLINLLWTKKYIKFLSKTKVFNQKLAEKGYEEFAKITPLFKKCKKGIIHGDFNLGNILIKNNRVQGIIDFSDAVKSLLVCDLAILISETCIEGKEFNQKLFKTIFDKYNEIIPLNKFEKKVLPYLIKSRILKTIVLYNYLKIKEKTSEYDHLIKWGLNAFAAFVEIENRI